MPLYTDIASLSQTPASNAADGTTDAPSTIDNNMNLLASFIAKLRDGAGYTAGAIAAALGYTPVQQGTGTSQLANTVKIGWSASTQLRLQIDATDYGVTWPINVAGNSATVGGIAAAEFVRRTTGNAMTMTWDGVNNYVYSSVDGIPQSAYVIWDRVQGKPTDLASFTNSPGFVSLAYTEGAYLKKEGAALSLGNISSSGLYVNISGFGAVSWGVTPSDQRLKTGIVPTTEDSLSKIAQIDFKQFRFRQDVTEMPVDDGRLHRLGVIAQDLEAIDSAWLQEGGTWKAPNQQALLYAALHAIQQLEAKVAALEARQ